MKLGITSDEQFALELSRLGTEIKPDRNYIHPSIEAEIVNSADREPRKGRGVGNVEVPNEIRKLIADDNLTNGRQSALELASDFGISPSSVSAYSKGSTSTASYREPDKTLTNYIKARKQRITKKALRVLTNSLDTLTPEKLSTVKARDLAGIAKDMSTVANNMSDKNESQSDGKPQFIVYAPQVRDERSYETIVVHDNY